MRKILNIMFLFSILIIYSCTKEDVSTTTIIEVSQTTTSRDESTNETTTTSEVETTTTTTENITEPDVQITVTNPDDLVVDFNEFKITKGDLYSYLKDSIGITSFINIIDRDILAPYQDEIDQQALEEMIAQNKNKQSLDDYYEDMVLMGVIDSKDDPDREQKIEDYYALSFLQRAYAKEQALENLDEVTIKEAKDNYKEEICVIMIKFELTEEVNQFSESLDQASDKLAFFTEAYEAENELVQKTVIKPFYTEPFTCTYDKVSYADYPENSQLRNYLYSDALGIGEYNSTTQFFTDDYTHYFIYKYSQPIFIHDYKNSNEFTNYIKNNLVEDLLTYPYIREQMNKLHQEISLKIYDDYIGKQYKDNLNRNFLIESDILDEQVVASYEVNDELKYVTADSLYDQMKVLSGNILLLEKINLEALSQIDEIQLSEDELSVFINQVENMKTNYENQNQEMSWEQYLSLYFGAFSETDLVRIMTKQQLIEDYILGNDDYTGATPITEADLQEEYDKWFSIQASHILFTFHDEASKDIAYKKAIQVIDGCTEDDILNDTSYIYYEALDDTMVPFNGLQNSTSLSVFSTLALAYSEDLDTKYNEGYLGYIGPNMMVTGFEEAVIQIANNKKDNGVPYSLSPVETKFGYHIIYVISQREKPAKPLNYDQYLVDLENNDTDHYTLEEIYKLNTYQTFIDGLKPDLIEERLKEDHVNKQLALLCQSMNFTFNDQELQRIYNNISSMYINE